MLYAKPEAKMKMPEWPAILKLEGIDELIYIADAQQWRREIKTLRQSGGDLLIDANGSLYSLQDDTLVSEDSPVPLAQFGELVRSHLVAHAAVLRLQGGVGQLPGRIPPGAGYPGSVAWTETIKNRAGNYRRYCMKRYP
jgi:hypothetical protein